MLASSRIAAIQTILFAVVAIWSLVELILLVRKRTNHPVISIALDVCSVVVLVLFGISVIGLIPARGGTAARALGSIGAVLVFCAAVFHIALFVRSCLYLRAKRREAKKVGWEREMGDRN
ncbi:hypothetical protein MW887_007248 [Aspergillus wentii]|nr:hypothetical protein MW887_007248 [Aspergillus wentii]